MKILRHIIVFGLALMFSTGLSAREDRHVFYNAFSSLDDKAAVFKPGGEWFPYPAYEDRAAWKKLLGPQAKNYIALGEKALKKEWPMQFVSQYLETAKTGTRKYSRGVVNGGMAMIEYLTIAELAEGKGRFIPKLIDGLYYYAEKASWSYHVHTKNQKNHSPVPRPDDRYISLGSANTGEIVAIAWHFFHKEFDKIDPSISKTILGSLDRNIFEPYLDSSKDKNHGWLGFRRKEGATVNNWNTYCNKFILMAFMLCEQDPARLLKAVEKSVRSVDEYMDYVKLDGACEEGPSYWTMAGGKVYEYVRMLFDISGGQINLFEDEQVHRMCAYIPKIYIGDSWIINFGDGAAHQTPSPLLIWRMGEDLDDQELRGYAVAGLVKKKGDKYSFGSPRETGGNIYRLLESCRYAPRLVETERAMLEEAGGDYEQLVSDIRKKVTSEWYPDTQVAALRNTKGWFLGAKGGHNGESHNHNDVGSCVFFIDAIPVLIDPGQMDYSKDTFSKNRYKLWTTRSDWHNLPDINGAVELPGKPYAAKDAQCNIAEGSFSCDLAPVYDPAAACKSWVRSYKLDDKSMTITDSYKLSAREDADVLNFITCGEVFVPGQKAGRYKVKKGEAVIVSKSSDESREVRVKVSFPTSMKAQVEENEFKYLDGRVDEKMFKKWPTGVRALRLTGSENAPKEGSYTVSFTTIK